MKAYIRKDPLTDERKAHYTPGQYGTFEKLMCMAARQQQRGRFRSAAALKGMLPAPYARHLKFLYAEGDLVLQADGTVYIDGWDEWQEGDFTVAERMARLRNRRRNATVTSGVTPTGGSGGGYATSVDDSSSQVDLTPTSEPDERDTSGDGSKRGPRSGRRNATVTDTVTDTVTEPSPAATTTHVDSYVDSESKVGFTAKSQDGARKPQAASSPRSDDQVARARAKLTDPDASPSIREAARAQLAQLGEPEVPA